MKNKYYHIWIIFVLIIAIIFYFKEDKKLLIDVFTPNYVKETFTKENFYNFLKHKWEEVTQTWVSLKIASNFKKKVISCWIIRDYSNKFNLDTKKVILNMDIDYLDKNNFTKQLSIRLKEPMSTDLYFIENPWETVKVLFWYKNIYKVLESKLYLSSTYMWDQVNFNDINAAYLLNNCYNLYKEYNQYKQVN